MQNEERDPYTGLWNRIKGLELLENAVRNCAQVALIFIDIDRLHSFNDQQGHQMGDEKILEIAHGIEMLSGENSVVFRYGAMNSA